MTSRFTPGIIGLALVLALTSASSAQSLPAAGPRAELARAMTAQRIAAARAGKLEASAAQASAAAERTARQSAALAARIQQTEAELTAGEARIALLEQRRKALRDRLALRQAPLVRLTAALQLMSRRPLALSVLRPGSVRDAVHLRAVLETMLPVVRRQTAGLRGELLRARRLESAVRSAQRAMRRDQGTLAERRSTLAALEARQRLASRAARGDANREADRAAAIAEEARDLTQLIGSFERAGALRRQLAALPGPVLRPAQPSAAQVKATAAPSVRGATLDYILPVAGTIVAGFGEASSSGGLRSQGITLATRSGAQVVAPAAGRIAFAGRYKGYGRIAIIEHAGGWTTLITNLARVTPTVGDSVVQGAPLGVAGAGAPRITIELRKDGAPVDVLAAVAGR